MDLKSLIEMSTTPEPDSEPASKETAGGGHSESVLRPSLPLAPGVPPPWGTITVPPLDIRSVRHHHVTTPRSLPLSSSAGFTAWDPIIIAPPGKEEPSTAPEDPAAAAAAAADAAPEDEPGTASQEEEAVAAAPSGADGGPALHVDPAAAALASLVENSRRFNLDLAPSFLLANGAMVEALVRSGVHQYCEFKAADASYLLHQVADFNSQLPIPAPMAHRLLCNY